jgi:uncharacterized protein YdaU (DUF1376 family)
MEKDTFVKSPAFQIYPADFLADKNTLVMSAAEVGAYWLLICVCWREDGLPDDVQELADVARTPVKQFRVSWERKIQRCFVLRDDGKWTHNRLEKEREKQAENRRKRQTAGEKGAKAKWQTDSNAMALPQNGNSKGMALDGLSDFSLQSSTSSSTSSNGNGSNNTHTHNGQNGVCVSKSKFSMQENLEYAWAAHNARYGINQPDAWAAANFSNGMYDELVSGYFADPATYFPAPAPPM